MFESYKLTISMHKVSSSGSIFTRQSSLANEAERVTTETTNMITTFRQSHKGIAISTTFQLTISLHFPESFIRPSSLSITVSCTETWILPARNTNTSQAFTAVEDGQRRFDDGAMRAVWSWTLEKVWDRSQKTLLDTLEILYHLWSCEEGKGVLISERKSTAIVETGDLVCGSSHHQSYLVSRTSSATFMVTSCLLEPLFLLDLLKTE